MNYPECILPKIKVMYIPSEMGPAGASNAFSKLEKKLGSLKKRKFYGLCFNNQEYWACVATQDDTEAQKLELPVWTIPEGKYAKAKIKDWTQKTHLIKPTFLEMEKEYPKDLKRPCLEFYRSLKELILYLPIKESGS